MNISILSNNFTPFTQNICSEITAMFSQSLVRENHSVKAVIMPIGNLNPELIEQHSLAKRIMPVKVTVDSAEYNFSRYEGKTSSGVEVIIIDCVDCKKPVTPQIAGQAAASLLSDDNSEIDFVFSVNDSFNLDTAVNKETKSILMITDPDISLNQIEKYDFIIVMGSATSGKLLEKAKNSQKELFLNGTIKTINIPPLKEIPEDHIEADRKSTKTTLQYNMGLPVKDVPVFYFGEIVTQADEDNLSNMLLAEIQLIATVRNIDEIDDSLKKLVNDFPDRLSLIPLDIIHDEIIFNCDFAFAGPALFASDCIKNGVIPVIDEKDNLNIIQVDPLLKSGNGIIYGEKTGISITGAAGNALSLYNNQSSFYEFVKNIQSTVPSWTQLSKAVVEYISK
ncbi:MAG: hypothetical protein JXR91_14620 [Deltaproteobacteria bacterium]|nr:hypothetical protein [Deltaproteobacteria bacterium]